MNDINYTFLGKLSFYGIKGGRQIGTGYITKYKGQVIVITAAHCIFDVYSKSYFQKIEFKNKKIKLTFKKAYLLTNWTKLEQPEYDIAILLPTTQPIIDNYSPISFNTSFNSKQKYLLLTHHPILPFVRPKYKSFFGKKDIYFNSSLIGFKCTHKGGLSGSPIFTSINGNLTLIGVVSLSFKQAPSLLWFAKYNDKFQKLFDAAASNLATTKMITSITY